MHIRLHIPYTLSRRGVTIFHTVIQSRDKKSKLVIDMGSSINVVSKDAVKLLNLKVEPHPNPFRVT